MPRKLKKPSLTIVLVVLFVLIGVGSMVLAIQNNNSSAETQAHCPPGNYENHKVTIQNDKMQPGRIDAIRCDTMTVTNMDDTNRIIAFGEHNHHIAYEGVTEKPLKKGQSFTIQLNQVGGFTFHDHLHDEVEASLVIQDSTN